MEEKKLPEALAMEEQEDDFSTRWGFAPRTFLPSVDTAEIAATGKTNEPIVTQKLAKQIKPRHLQMIAVGGSVGTGLFVGSGSALAAGGPGSLLIAFSLMGFMLFNLIYALGELALMFPITGGCYYYVTRFVHKIWGQAMGYNYLFLWLIVLPLELTTSSIVVRYWGDVLPVGAWTTIFYVFIAILSFFPVWFFGEEEFYVSLIKLLSIVAFIIMAIILCCGNTVSEGPYSSFVGGRYWSDPGPFRNGFDGFCATLVTAGFSLAGSELVGVAAAESKNPKRSIPRAVKQVFWRVVVFYLVSLLLVGLLVPYNDPRLLGTSSADIKASPFVIVAFNAGIRGIDTFFNAIILMSMISIGLTSVYAGSRTLAAIAEQGYGPKLFTTVDRAGRPTWAIVFVLASGPLAFMNTNANSTKVFTWFLSSCALSTFFLWASLCIAHIRFRQAWRAQGHSLDEIPFKAKFGVAGSYISLVIVALALVCQIVTAVRPLSGGPTTVGGFFQAMLAAPVIMLSLGVAWFMRRKTGEAKWISANELDIVTGRRHLDTVEMLATERELARSKPWYRRLFNYFC